MTSPTAETKEISSFSSLQAFEGHTNFVSGIIHLPGGQRTITSSLDGSLRLWNMESGLQIGRDWRDGDSPVLDIALSPDGKRVVSGSRDRSVRLWDIRTERMIAKWTGHMGAIIAVCWSEDGRRVVSGCKGGTAMEWDVESGENTLGPLQISNDITFAFAFSPKKATIAIVTMRNKRYSEEIWDFKTRRLVITLNHDGKRRITDTRLRVNCLVWTTDGEFQVGGDREFRLSPNGHILAIAGFHAGALLLNLENGQPIVGQFETRVDCMSFSADGKLLSCGFTARHYEESKPADVKDCFVETYDFEAILKTRCLWHLLLDAPKDDDKPILDGDATKAAVHQPGNVRRLHHDFFDDTQDYHQSPLRSPTGHGHARGTPSAPHKWRFRLLSRSEHTARERQTLNWTGALFSGQLFRQDQPYGGRPAVVNTPYTRGQDRNVKASRESEQKAPASSNIVTITVPGPSRPQNSGTDHQYSEDVPGNSPLPSQLAVNTTPTAATTASAPALDTMMIRQVGSWSRFWLSLGCISTEERH